MVYPAGHDDAVFSELQQRMAATEIGTRDKLHDSRSLASEHTMKRASRLLQEIRHLHALPSGFHREGVIHIPLAQRLGLLTI